MLRLSIEVLLGLDLVASVALDSSTEVVVLALGTDPPTIGKIKVGVGARSMTRLLHRNYHLVAVLSSVSGAFI